MFDDDLTKTKMDSADKATLWSSVAGAAANMFATGMQYGSLFNADARQAQVDIAQANAMTNQPQYQERNEGKNYILIGGVLLVLVVIGMVLLRKPK